jgi:hypothetical protein
LLGALSPLLLAGCLGGPSSSSSPVAAAASSGDRARPAVASPCPVEQALPVYRLGADTADQPLLGNSQPVTLQVRIGERFVIVSRFAERGLTPPVSTGTEVQALCTLEVATAGGGTKITVEFEAVRAGHAHIESRTNDCGACANFPLVADVTVTP